MTVKINLLPHREERRKRQRQRFVAMAVVTVAAALVAAGVVYFTLQTMVDNQTGRNTFLKRENEKLDKERAEIKKLKEDIQALLARKQVIETLQADRSQSVQLLDQLVRQTPDGVYLRAIKQEGRKVNVLGFAQSNARVSTLMRNVQTSPVLETPTLVEIKAAQVSNKRVSDFNLNFSMKAPRPEEAAKAGGAVKPAAQAGGAPGQTVPAAKPAAAGKA